MGSDEYDRGYRDGVCKVAQSDAATLREGVALIRASQKTMFPAEAVCDMLLGWARSTDAMAAAVSAVPIPRERGDDDGNDDEGEADQG